jgi:hypothetical protein
MAVKDLNAKQAREKLAVKQAELGKVFEQATADGGADGRKQYDFSKVTCLGDDVKGSIAVAEKVKAMNAELDELAGHAETLEAAEKAAEDHAGREKQLNRPFMPNGGGRDFSRQIGQLKSLGDLVGEAKEYQSWAKSGAAGGLTLGFDELLPSEMLAKAAQFDTVGTKTLMATSAGYAPESVRLPGLVEAVTRPIQLLDIIPLARTGQAAVPYME